MRDTPANRRWRRRDVLIGTTLLTGLAGCTVPQPPSQSPYPHVFAHGPTTVAIRNSSSTDHDVEQIARDALTYWEDNSVQYAGFPVRFEVVESEDSAIVIEFVDEPSACRTVESNTVRVLGCAPLIRQGRSFDRVATAYVVAANRPVGKIRITTKHELGHILGLGHDDEPLEIMSHLPEHRIPLFEVRIAIWELVLDAHELGGEAFEAFSRGSEQWSANRFDLSVEEFSTAYTNFSATHSKLADALERTGEFVDHPRVETVDLETLTASLSHLLERMDHAMTFTSLMVDASAAAAAGSHEEANQHRISANESIQAFHDLDVTPINTIAIALGLVRGFDQDEPVVDVDTDPITE